MILVGTAIIKNNDKFLITLRTKGTYHSRKWEFPSGK